MPSPIKLTTYIALLIAACASCTTQRNPRYCGDGACTDPAFPFCDVQGQFGDYMQQCVAVDCTPDAFIACRGDHELRCNPTGTNYDITRCELGCDPSGGCRLCEANQSACTNGMVATCDAAGNVVSSEACPLGCFEDQPRCREIDPSNGLGRYLDMVPNPPDLDLDRGAILTTTGQVLHQNAELPGIPTFLIPPSAPGHVPVRVLVVRNARLSSVQVVADMGELNGAPRYTGPALAILARGSIVVDGRLSLTGGAGSLTTGSCVGAPSLTVFEPGQTLNPGSGGGGHATAGARGGDIMYMAVGSSGGAATGTETLVPLRGGCASGEVFCGNCPGAAGGGALQLSSRQYIEVNSPIDVRGQTPLEVAGGGAGGGILLEAPTVRLGAEARLIATGGAGGSGVADSHELKPVADDGLPEQGVTCIPPSIYCGTGGNGASAGVPATPGATVAYTNSPSVMSIGSGGGGGGLGRIRINTPDRTYTRANTAIEAGASSTGTLPTR